MAGDDDGINCDDAEHVGSKIQSEMDGKVFTAISLSKKKIVKTLVNLGKGVSVENETLYMQNGNLFVQQIKLCSLRHGFGICI
jgi:hypothetical protein